LPWLILLTGAAITWQQYHAQQSRTAQVERARFESRATEVALGLERRLQSIGDLLRGVAGLFSASDEVDRSEFHQYVETLQLTEHYAGIQGIGFSRWVAARNLRSHTSAIRQEGYPDYAIHPTGARDHYSAIVYLEPFDWRNRRAFGFDVYTEPLRQAAMRSSVDTGQMRMTDKVTLVQETEKDVQAGFLIYLPVFGKGRMPETASERWRVLEGWAYSPIRSGDLVNAFMKNEYPALLAQVHMRLYASSTPSNDALLFDNHPDRLPGANNLSVSRDINMHGARWRMTLEVLNGSVQTDTVGTGYSMLWSGAALTLALATLAFVVQRSHRRVARALASAMEANHKLAQSQRALRLAGTVMEASPLGIFVTDADRRIVSVNPAYTAITGVSREAALGSAPPTFANQQHSSDAVQQLWDDVDHNGTWEGEIDSRRHDGSPYPQRLTLTRVRDDRGNIQNYIGLFSDITEQRKAEENIRQLALHDYLTGLPNRAMFVDRATRELQTASRYGHHPAMLFIDLDRFKPINDNHGHETGDEVLIQVGRRLSGLLRETDLVCRQGGDEFVVLLPDHQDDEGLQQLAHKLLAAIETPYAIKGELVSLSASIGIAVYPRDGDTVDALTQSADSAMYRAKDDPDSRICLASAAPRHNGA
jgi:diguanylate cyclase (GGDEF)-like protein/PAS domain S-box-containing protein